MIWKCHLRNGTNFVPASMCFGYRAYITVTSLSVSNYRRLDCLLNRCPGADERKQKGSASLAFVGGNCPHKGPLTRKMFPFDDVIMHINSHNSRDLVAQLTWRTSKICNKSSMAIKIGREQSNFEVSSVPADARTSADTVMTKVGSRIDQNWELSNEPTCKAKLQNLFFKIRNGFISYRKSAAYIFRPWATPKY